MSASPGTPPGSASWTGSSPGSATTRTCGGRARTRSPNGSSTIPTPPPGSTAAPPRSADCLGGVPEARIRHLPRMLAARKEDNVESPRLEYTAELLRHFADLRDGTHGGAVRRQDKERFFSAAITLLDPHARQVLNEINTDLLLGTGAVTATGARPRGGGVEATWAL